MKTELKTILIYIYLISSVFCYNDINKLEGFLRADDKESKKSILK